MRNVKILINQNYKVHKFVFTISAIHFCTSISIEKISESSVSFFIYLYYFHMIEIIVSIVKVNFQ